MPKRNSKYWLFDLDGTLIDSVGLIMDSFAHAMTKHRQDTFDPQKFRHTIGRSLREQFGLYSDDEDEVARLIETYSQYYRAHRSQTRLFDGVREVLENLQKLNTPLAIVTSKSHIGAVNSTKALNIDHYFDIMIGSDDVVHAKPHPEPVLKALTHFEATPDQAIFIGDSPHDIHAGKAAKVYTIGVTWGPYTGQVLLDAGADRIVDSVHGLLSA
jgi:pyrophosphatase PpaX